MYSGTSFFEHTMNEAWLQTEHAQKVCLPPGTSLHKWTYMGFLDKNPCSGCNALNHGKGSPYLLLE